MIPSHIRGMKWFHPRLEGWNGSIFIFGWRDEITSFLFGLNDKDQLALILLTTIF